MIDFCPLESDGKNTVFDVDVHVRVQVFIYGYFDMRSRLRLLVVKSITPSNLMALKSSIVIFLVESFPFPLHGLLPGQRKHSYQENDH